jgi:hypothetical protein
MSEPMGDDDYIDERDDESPYCECGAFHDYTEEDWNRCACCGKPIDPNE